MTVTSGLPAEIPASSSILPLLGPPPLGAGDAAASYETLLTRLVATVAPGDVIEEAWVRDVADLLWEAVRLRRLKTALMTACADEGMRKLLEGIGAPGSTYDASRGWAARELTAVGRVDALLDAAGLGIDHVMARTLAQRITEIERIDRMIAGLEARRAATLREIDHRRAALAARLRDAATQVGAQVTDAEFAEVTAGPAATETPA
jgi:hypothetical protein